MKNIVYIDAQNVHKSLQVYQDWLIDWEKFLVYLREKFRTDEVKIFFGFVSKYQRLYKHLESLGYTLCFKETLVLPDGKIKGNVDIDIAIFAVQDFYEGKISKAILVTGDGDYNSLVDFWNSKGVFSHVLVPGIKNSSVLLRRVAGKNLIDIGPMKNKLQKMR